MSDTSARRTASASPTERSDRAIQLIEAVGNTPLIELKKIGAEVAPVRLMVKAEWFNPGGSVKDRPALNMVLKGEESGALTRDKVLMDSTSGNTGIAYAMIGAALDYRVKLCVPKNIALIRQRILTAYGAELVFTDPTRGSDGAQEEAIRLYAEDPDRYFYPNQYGNDANWQAHYNGTGVEILQQTAGEVTHFIAGLGTTGTFCGTGKRLKEERENIRLISFQPDSPMHGLEGMKHLPTSIRPDIYNEVLADENLWIKTEDAQEMVLRLAREEGILSGMSGGASVMAALTVARTLSAGTVVTVIPDSGHKYMDFEFWDQA